MLSAGATAGVTAGATAGVTAGAATGATATDREATTKER
jgi:hypothetical protein